MKIILKAILICFLFSVLFSFSVFAQNNPAKYWQNIERKIGDSKVKEKTAVTAIFQANKQVREYLAGQVFERTKKDKWVFPLKGYGRDAVRTNDYVPGGYNFFEGNRHAGHPAYDIFIRDWNFDCRDDRTGKPVPVVSITSGIVVSMNDIWAYPSQKRGGRYIYIYDDVSDRFFYYAHLSKLFIKTGDIVRAGDVLGFVGRTGKNAYPHRSPTHLHLMVLDAKTMKSIDFYNKHRPVKKKRR